MINVDDKPLTKRIAIAEGYVKMKKETLEMIMNGKIKKGDTLCVSKIAGISGAKYASILIPMCHPIPLSDVEVNINPANDDTLKVEASVIATWKTGVEMEALMAVSITCLNIYDMCKYIDRSMIIGSIRLTYKNGGKSGEFRTE
jgi:cyclic pyranopterin phosphate synthase